MTRRARPDRPSDAWEWLARRERPLLAPSDARAACRIAVVYPNTYHVGMSSLAMHALYRLLSGAPRVRCERAFLASRRPGHAPTGSAGPVSFETQTPLARFDALTFSIAFELDYLNVLRMLDEAGVPPLSRHREHRHPLLMAGGVAPSANPQPVADIFDAIVIGEVEPIADALTKALSEALPRARRSGNGRQAALDALAELPGVYVPSRLEPGGAITKLTAEDLDEHETASAILTPDTEFANSFLVEVGRGCPRGCRFCLAGHIYRPFRQRSVPALLRMADFGLEHTRRIGLVGSALSDYRRLEELVTALRAREADISTSSLRAESVTPTLLQALADSGQRQITLAPEAATPRLRRLLGKPTPDDRFDALVDMGLARGIRAYKLYFMIGLPTETGEDAIAIADCMRRLESAFPRARFSAAVSPFVPKPHTPFQWAPMPDVDALDSRHRALRDAFAGLRSDLALDSPRWAYIQAALSRGGPELAEVLPATHQSGGSARAFLRALREHDLDPDAAFAPCAGPDAPLPWDIVDAAPGAGGVERAKQRLWRQWQQGLTGA
ncbi:MAG: radical SAM protein [Armatimonadota bacterium]